MSSLATQSAADSISSPVAAAQAEPRYLGYTLTSWVKFISLGLLFLLVFWPNLRRLWLKTNPITGEENWKHGLFVPLIGIYYLYINREHLSPRLARTSWAGLGITLAGLLFFAYAIWPGQNDYFKDLGMVITLFGLVTLMAGWPIMKTAWFPIVYLICAIPWPGLFYSLIAGPLQWLAAKVAVHVLSFLNTPALQSGTKLFIFGKNGFDTLNVAEACSGLKSLMTFVTIAGAVAFLSVRPLWQKVLITLSAIPIAITCNMLRVTVQGLAAASGHHEFSEGFAHGFLGLTMMIPAFFLILGVAWFLDNLLIDEVDNKQALRAAAASARKDSGLSTPGARIGTTRPAAAGPASSSPRPSVASATVAAQALAKSTSRPGGATTAAANAAPAAPERTAPGSAAPVAPAKVAISGTASVAPARTAVGRAAPVTPASAASKSAAPVAVAGTIRPSSAPPTAPSAPGARPARNAQLPAKANVAPTGVGPAAVAPAPAVAAPTVAAPTVAAPVTSNVAAPTTPHVPRPAPNRPAADSPVKPAPPSIQEPKP